MAGLRFAGQVTDEMFTAGVPVDGVPGTETEAGCPPLLRSCLRLDSYCAVVTGALVVLVEPVAAVLDFFEDDPHPATISALATAIEASACAPLNRPVI